MSLSAQVVSHGAIELLMSRAGIRGVTGRPRWRRLRPELVSKDLVERDFIRSRPNQLWVTDIERHEALLNRAVVRGHRGRSVAAGREAGGSSIPGMRRTAEAALTTTGRASTA
jgi:hypothetical protein